MSTIPKNVTPLLAPEVNDGPPKRVRVYKPRLATTVKVAMEGTLEHAIRSQTIMRGMLHWLTTEREQMSAELHRFEQLSQAGLADRATQLARALHHQRVARLGDLDHQIAELALELAETERVVRDTLDKSKMSREPQRKEHGYAQ